VAWLEEAGLSDSPIFAPNPWVTYRMGIIERPRAHKGPALLASMPEGTIVVWDSVYCPSDFHRIPLDLLEGSPDYKRLRSFDCGASGGVAIRVYRKRSPASVSKVPDASYPVDLAARRRPVRGVYYIRPGG
jgi:hypothetical protein